MFHFQDGKTALYWAVEKGHVSIVKALIEYNANTEIGNKVGYLSESVECEQKWETVWSRWGEGAPLTSEKYR